MLVSRRWMMSLFAAAVPALCAADPPLPDKLSALREKIRAALAGDEQQSDRAGGAYQELFTSLGLTGIKQLITDPETSVALQALWETEKRVVKRSRPVLGRTDWVLEKKSVQAFLGGFERRTGSEVPDWWKRALASGEVFPARLHYFELEDLPAPPKVVQMETTVSIDLGKRTMSLTKPAYEAAESMSPGQPPVALWGRERSFLARPSHRGYPFHLMALDTRTGQPQWKAPVWAARRGFSSGPRGRHRVEIRRSRDTIVVYGRESHGMYVEAFDAESGACRFRFCTCYWFNFSEEWGLK